MLPVLPSATKTQHIVHHLDNNNTQRNSVLSKRNTTSSMIFRIEHLLPTSTAPDISAGTRATTSTSQQQQQQQQRQQQQQQQHHQRHESTTRRGKIARAGVYVSQFTPKDTISETVNTLGLMSIVQHVTEEQQMTTRTFCTLTQDGVLCMTPAILRKIKLSEDIHSHNAIFELSSSGAIRVHVVRDIAQDNELVAWFGDELTLLMSIPFLTPLNIQGNNRYTCHLCHLTFETPNPLKIHLALGCGRQSLDIIWIRLHYAIKATRQLLPTTAIPTPLHTPPQRFITNTTRTTPTPTASKSSISPAASPQLQITTAAAAAQPSPQASPNTQTPPPARFSAFKPICTSTPTSSTSAASAVSLNLPPTSLHISLTTTAPPTSGGNTLSFLPSLTNVNTLAPMSLLHPTTTNQLNAAAQIEAIVSNMGASKQGHLCIYCGKVYSRKYGLKIHIRTHTGFKPLKCKFCLRPFGDPSNLNKHVRLHMQSNTGNSGGPNNEGYKCHLCQKTLARRRDLQRHMESRHGTSSSRVR